MSNFMKISPVPAELFHAEFRDKRIDMLKLTVAFHNFENMLKTGTAGHRARGWLRKCAANRKVVGLFPDDVTCIFHWLNPPGLTMALGLTRSVTEISTMCTCDYRCNFTCVCLYVTCNKNVLIILGKMYKEN